MSIVLYNGEDLSYNKGMNETRSASRMFDHDYAAMLALSDQRAAAKRAARASAMANHELVATLTEQAHRRGEGNIDWPEYFRNIGP